MSHPFFDQIKSFPDFEAACRIEIINLPEAYRGKEKLKAILLGTDPTNKDIQEVLGLKVLNHPFGINSRYEKRFFSRHQENITQLGLDFNKEYFFVQNLCRNYFHNETTENIHWLGIAKSIWIDHLAEELSNLDPTLPVLATAEVITLALVPGSKKGQGKDIYSGKVVPNYYSPKLKRYVYPFYRHDFYRLTKWPAYTEFLKTKLNE